MFHDSTRVSFSMQDIPSIATLENDGKLEQSSKLEVACFQTNPHLSDSCFETTVLPFSLKKP